jgi:hypothetical protein
MKISVQREMRSRRIASAVAYLGEYRKLYGKTGEDIAKNLGRSAAKELANYTHPWGLKSAVGKKFEQNIMKQAHRALKAGNIAGAPGGAAQVHEAARDKDGRVPKGLKTFGQFKRAPIELPERMRYTEDKSKQAGISKGAWIAAGESLGGPKISGIPKWIRRHVKNGSGTISKGRDGAEVTLSNDLGFVTGRKFESAVKPALAKAYKSQLSYMRNMVKRFEKKATQAQ